MQKYEKEEYAFYGAPAVPAGPAHCEETVQSAPPFKRQQNALNPKTHFEQTFLNELEILLEHVTNNVSLVSKFISSKTKLIIISIVMNNKKNILFYGFIVTFFKIFTLTHFIHMVKKKNIGKMNVYLQHSYEVDIK